MKYKWPIMRLATLADIQTGPFGSQLHQKDYVNEGTPIVTVEHLGNKNFTEQNLPCVSDEDRDRLKKYILQTGDIVFSRVGSVDRCSFVSKKYDGWMFSGRCLRVHPRKMLNAEYLYYFFLLESTKQFVRNIATGATMPSINTKFMGEVPVVVPPLDVQEDIVDVLRHLDDKIQLNTEINKNLAEQLQALYTSEFDVTVHHATAKLSDICHYSVEKVNVDELSTLTYYSTENMQPNKVSSVEATNLPSIKQTTRCHKGDVLVSNIRPYFKKIEYVTTECGCSADVLCFVPASKELSAFLYETLYADRFFDYMVAGSKGTKMPRGDKQQIMQYGVVMPSYEQFL